MANGSYLRLTKSETREMADREYHDRLSRKPDEWNMSNHAFFAAFVVIAALLTLLALLLR